MSVGAKRQQLGSKIQQGFADMQSAKMTERKYEGQVKAARQVSESFLGKAHQLHL